MDQSFTGENATKRLPVKPTTKRLLDESKDNGVTYDKWIRDQLEGTD